MADDPQTVPNIDYLGKCYDVVDVNPLNLGASHKRQNAIDLKASGEEVTADRRWVIPKGVHHSAPFSMTYDSQSVVISSSSEFQQEFKKSVAVEAGVEGAFEFSGSASMKDIERQTETREHSFVYSRAYQEDHIVSFDLADKKAPLAITREFQWKRSHMKGTRSRRHMKPLWAASGRISRKRSYSADWPISELADRQKDT